VSSSTIGKAQRLLVTRPEGDVSQHVSFYNSNAFKGQFHAIFYVLFASISSIWAFDSLAASFSKISQNFQSYSNLEIFPRCIPQSRFKQIS
jgi:hypothetical protein